jgi:hypothetical protein
VRTGSSGESKEKVPCEIPEYCYTRRHQLGQVKVLLTVMMHVVQDSRVDPEPDNSDHKKFAVLYKHLRIPVMKSPCPVDEVICCRRNNKPHRVGKVFMRLYDLFKKIGDTKIDDHADKTGYSEMEKFDDEILDIKILHSGKDIKELGMVERFTKFRRF